MRSTTEFPVSNWTSKTQWQLPVGKRLIDTALAASSR